MTAAGNRAARRTLTAAAGALAVAAWLLWTARTRVLRIVVRGESMRPALAPGDRVVALRGVRPVPGDVVVVRDLSAPGQLAVKRLAAGPGGAVRLTGGEELASGDGYLVFGDRPTLSTDSRQVGPVPRRMLAGRVVYRYHPSAVAGRVRRATPGWATVSRGAAGRGAAAAGDRPGAVPSGRGLRPARARAVRRLRR